MRKLLFGAVATAIVALQPTLALAQARVPSDFLKESAPVTNPTVTNVGPVIPVLQAIPVVATATGIGGVLETNRCIVGGTAGGRPGTFEPIRFVGNVLCLDPGPEGEFRSFAVGCPAGTTAVVQGLKLIKTVPLIPKCPDIYPGQTFIQTPATTGIRTWWPLKYTPCDTTFELRVEFACVQNAAGPGGRREIVSVRENRFRFRVTVLPNTLAWVVHALHNQPLGTCEVPCITDEGLFDRLLRQADTIASEAARLPGRVRELNTAIDVMEATIVQQCLFLLTVAQVTRDTAGNVTAIASCGALPGGPAYGNFTIADFGFGIVDTLEHPCCCKLIADLYCLKGNLIGRDP